MKISINIDNRFPETEIIIHCSHMDGAIEQVVATLRAMDQRLTGTKNNQTYILDASNVLYIDTTDKKTFLYTNQEVYETSLKLYELEQQLSGNGFFRAGKSCIINFNRIHSLKSDIDGRIIVTMENNEKLIVSRQYAAFVKKKLGG